MALILIIIFLVKIAHTYWEKPKGIFVPLTILEFQNDIPNNAGAALGKRFDEATLIGTATNMFTRKKGQEVASNGSRIRNHNQLESSSSGDIGGILLGSVVFGAVHLAAWNFEYPGRIDMILWRVSSVFCTIGVLISVLFANL